VCVCCVGCLVLVCGGRDVLMADVLKKLKGESGFTLETQFVLLVSQVTEGIPYIQIGTVR